MCSQYYSCKRRVHVKGVSFLPFCLFHKSGRETSVNFAKYKQVFSVGERRLTHSNLSFACLSFFPSENSYRVKAGEGGGVHMHEGCFDVA